jgi:hypothetical protein
MDGACLAFAIGHSDILSLIGVVVRGHQSATAPPVQEHTVGFAPVHEPQTRRSSGGPRFAMPLDVLVLVPL